MIKLSTIQKRENLNKVYAVSEKGNGEAYHEYKVVCHSKDGNQGQSFDILFQNGPRDVEGSLEGVLDVDLLEIVRHRLQCFQEGQFATRENEIALTHIEEALMWMNRRVEDRIERNVLGTNNR